MDVMCDLVLLSWNHLEETQACLESLFHHTDVPSRLVIVDNGSEPSVREFLKQVRPQGAIQEVVLIQNETNEGFPKGMNRGIQASRAPYVCLLNNDLLLTPNWLSRLLEVAEAHPEIGILNPVSNTFGNRPPRGVSVEAYAASLAAKRGLYVEVGMCIGFCMLIRREVIDHIGVLTEEIERIFFEDEDYCMRAKAAGFQCVVVEDAYVFHAEHQTLRLSPEREVLFNRNRRWCEQKWGGRRLRFAYPRFEEVRAGADGLQPWLEQLIRWARNRTLIYVYCPLPGRDAGRELFRSVGLVPHANISWHPIPGIFVRVMAACAILKRRKKRFDIIIAPDERWAVAMRRLQWLHRARVIPAADSEALAQLWQTRPQFPL